MSVNSSEILRNDLIMKLPNNFKSTVNHLNINNRVVNTVGGRMVDTQYNFINGIANDLYRDWNSNHNSITTALINMMGEGNPYGIGGKLIFTPFNLHITKIYVVSYYDIICNAIEICTNLAFNTYLNSYAFGNLPMEFDGGQYYGGSYNKAKNKLNSIGSVGSGSEANFSNLSMNIRAMIAGVFNSSGTNLYGQFIDAYSEMVNNQFNIYKNNSKWTKYSIVCLTGVIASGGSLN